MKRLTCAIIVAVALGIVAGPGLAGAEQRWPHRAGAGGRVDFSPYPNVVTPVPGFVTPYQGFVPRHHGFASPHVVVRQPQWYWQPGFWQWNGQAWSWTPSTWVQVFPRY